MKYDQLRAVHHWLDLAQERRQTMLVGQRLQVLGNQHNRTRVDFLDKSEDLLCPAQLLVTAYRRLKCDGLSN